MKIKFRHINVLQSLIPQILNAIISITSYYLYTNLVVPEMLGRMFVVFAFFAFFDLTVSASLNQTTFLLSKNLRKVDLVINSLGKGKFYVKVLLLLFTVAAIRVFHDEDTWLLLLFAPYLYIELDRARILSIANIKLGRFSYGMFTFLESCLAVIVFVLLGYISYDTSSMIVSVLVARLINSRVMILVLSRNKETESMNSYGLLRQLIEYRKDFINIFFMGVIGWLTAHADKFLIAIFLSSDSVAVLAILLGVIGRPYNVLGIALTSHYRPGFYNIRLNSNSIIKVWMIIFVVLGLLGLVCISSGYHLLSGFIPDVYLNALGDFGTLTCIIFLINGLSFPLDNYLISVGATKNLRNLQLVHALFYLFGLITLGRSISIKALLLLKISAEIIRFLLVLIYKHRRESINCN